MGRAPRPEAEGAVVKVRVEGGRQHLQQRLLDQPIQHRRHPQLPRPAGELRDLHPPDRLRPVSARLELRAHVRPVLHEPRPQLLRAHPIDASGTGVLLDTSERRREIPAGEETLPQARVGGVRRGHVRRRGATPLSASTIGLHPPALPSRPLSGLAALIATPTSTNVLRLGSAFGPSRRPSRSPPVLRPLLTSPRRAAISRPPPSLTRHPWRPPGISHATFSTHPPHLRNGLSMTTGFAMPCWLAQTAPPPMRFVSLGSWIRTPASFPPRLTTEQLPSARG